MAQAKPAPKPAPASARPAPTTAKPATPPPAAAKPAAPAPSASRAVAAAKPTAVANADVPDYIKQGGGRGNEAVEMSDVVIPRIEIVQALSPVLKQNDPAFIPGISQGDMYNTVTRDNLGKALTVVPVMFKKEYLVWKDRQKGGGFRGAYGSISEAQDRIAGEDDADDLDAIETAQQLVLVVNDDGSASEAMVSMAKTKLSVSKQWNSLIRLNGNDRFSRTYSLFTVEDSNEKGDYFNFGVSNAGFPDQDVYQQAEALYNAVASGARKVVVDTSDEGAEGVARSNEY